MFTRAKRFYGTGVVLLGIGCLLLSSGCGLLEEMKDTEAENSSEALIGWAVEVFDLSFGDDAGFGQGLMPDVVLGPSNGAGTQTASLDVVSLGVGGIITVGFGPNHCIVDQEGDDLTVLENVFCVAGEASNRFIETGWVAVSQDGENFFEFPSAIEESLPLGDPDRYMGFAGVEPALPGDDPVEVGGDRFDLSQVGLGWARYVRITDTAGDPVDPGDELGAPDGKAGFDLDAVGAIHVGEGAQCQ